MIVGRRFDFESFDLILCFLQVFAELFDPVIKDRHNGYDPRTMTHPTDLDSSKVFTPPLPDPSSTCWSYMC